MTDEKNLVIKIENAKRILQILSEKRHSYAVGSKDRIMINLQFINIMRESNSLKNQLIEFRAATQTRLYYQLRKGDGS